MITIMKRMIVMFAALLLAAPLSGLWGQDKGKSDWQERWKAEKVAFLTDAMDLSSAEAEKFWPVYNRSEKEKKEAFQKMIAAYKALDDALNAGKDEAEIQKLLDKYLDAQQLDKGINKKYTAEYRKILSGKKVAQLFIAEEEFRRQQIHRLKKDDCRGGDRK